jgi:hypothetical protein
MLGEQKLVTFAGVLVAFLLTPSMTPSSASANSVSNPGFELIFTDWTPSGSVGIGSGGLLPNSPDGGNRASLNAFSAGVGSSSLTQDLGLLAPGSYAFGAYVSLAARQPLGNFTQAQISLTAQGTPQSSTVGTDANARRDDFTNPGGAGFSFTPWFLLSGTFEYSGPGSAPFLININVQNGTEDQRLAMFVDGVYVTPVPIPAALPLFATGVAAVAYAGRRKRKAKAIQAAA